MADDTAPAPRAHQAPAPRSANAVDTNVLLDRYNLRNLMVMLYVRHGHATLRKLGIDFVLDNVKIDKVVVEDIITGRQLRSAFWQPRQGPRSQGRLRRRWHRVCPR